MDVESNRSNGLSKRVPAHTTAAFVDRAGQTAGVLYDLSRTGALLSTSAPCRAGAKGTLKVKSYRSRSELSFSCEVVRQAMLPDVGIGLQFTGMGLAALLWLNNHCAFYHERKRVVMIDDDATALTMMERILTTEGYKFIGFDTSARCEVAVKRIQPAMIMIDTKMGSKDGFDLITRLRDTPEIERTPLLLCSDAGAPDVTASGLPTVQKKAPREEIVNAVRFVTKA
ncbi:MAG: PilZ domain-containing protein [Deltaproteobacteria bacterium]|nr:PilZ domain-containing protein [Deltaproteobacteria bacterium]